MKKSIFGLLISLTNICFGQINLENTYSDGYVTRVLLENSGEKYYLTDQINKQVKIYNSNHTLWKTINLPTTAGATLSAVAHLSETKINADNLIELTYSYFINNGGTLEYESRVINENGTTLLTVTGASGIYLSEIQGLSNKLIAFVYGTTGTSRVYSLPSLSLEHTYNDGYVTRTNLENSGEKYYLTDQINKQVKIYNSNHSSWKTINLLTTSGATLSAVAHLSETKINADNLIELTYSYFINNGGTLEYESRVINENGTTLLTVTGASGIYLSEIQGLSNKLIAFVYGTTGTSRVYSLPSLSLEHTYNDGYVTRTNLENSGEKYYLTDQINKQVKIYNSNHSSWKTINLPTTAGATLSTVAHLSETKINADNLIELTYSYFINNGGTLEYESRVINENGTTLLTVTGASGIYLSEIQGLPNKLIAFVYGTSATSKVYGLPTTGTSGINELTNIKVKTFPNPTSDFLYIESDLDSKIDNITIYNMEGKSVLELLNFNNLPINVSGLNKGIYFISGHQDNDVLFHSKFIVD